ncbi:MAG: DUF3043 domain-containing protein [Propionibacteriaceae bacterium]|nr:DUF3043 domain-containing protein [Propionibacteriaceae bacterium]
MGLFKPYDQAAGNKAPAQPSPVQSTTPAEAPKPPAKKTIPTPTRRQAEQARRDRLQPVLTRKQSKVREREARYKAQNEAMAKNHARPHNVLIRDWIDGRWNITEFILPVMLVVFAVAIGGTYFLPAMTLVAPYIMWGVIGVLILDIALMWLGLRKHLKTYFPDEPLKGKLSYALSRSMMMRRTRVPPPRVKRGTRFTWPHPEDPR